MRVVITGATGNIGTSVTNSLLASDGVSEIIGVSRHPPQTVSERLRFIQGDVAIDDLEPVLRGADCLVHLAWLIQPSREERLLEAVNVDGTRRVLESAIRAGVRHLVVASSLGAYSVGPKDRRVDERWPTDGIPTSQYSRQKAAVERIMNELEERHPDVLIARMRPGLVFKRAASSEIKRLFLGRWWPNLLFNRALVPFVPDVPGLRFQCVHAEDVARAFRLVVERRASGAFNLVADPPLEPQRLGRLLNAKPLAMTAKTLRSIVAASYRMHIQPAEPGWLDMALNAPLLDAGRAERELGWTPVKSATEAFEELFDGIRDGAGRPTPPLGFEPGRRGAT